MAKGQGKVAPSSASNIHKPVSTSNGGPTRTLTTRVITRKSQESGTVAPGKLVDHAKPFGVK